MTIFRNTIHTWLPLAVVITLLSAVLYAVVQQTYRTAADDPQIQMAEETAARLAAGEDPQAVLPPGEVDLAVSLAPYIIVFDAAQEPVASNAVLHGVIPIPPGGVLDVAREAGGNRVTHQPETGVRSAVVIVPIGGGDKGFVLAGRSLREVEARVGRLDQMILMGLAGTLFGTLVIAGLVEGVPFLRRLD